MSDFHADSLHFGSSRVINVQSISSKQGNGRYAREIFSALPTNTDVSSFKVLYAKLQSQKKQLTELKALEASGYDTN